MNQHDNDITLDRLADFLEGTLPEAEAARIRQALETSDALRAEYEWLRMAAEDIEAIGAHLEADSPEIDVVDGVMQTLEQAGASSNTVRLDSRKGKTRPGLAFWGAAALAAAVLLLMAGLAVRLGVFAPDTPDAPQVSEALEVPERPEDETLAVETEETPETDRLVAAMQQLVEGTESRLETSGRRVDRSTIRATDAPRIGDITVDEVVSLRQAALTNPEAWARLTQMATLDAGAAAEVAADPDAPPGAIVGVAASLSAEEARQLLVTAVGRMDQPQPYARLALAKTYLAAPFDAPEMEVEAPPPVLLDGMTPDDLHAFLNEIAALQALDPGNALFDALRAGALFRLGDTAGALAALQDLQAKEVATAYGLDSARSREQALTSAGMPEETARVLSAMLAGADEYNMLCDLARELLQSGQAYEAQGDLDTARDVYEATRRLGEQVAGNAPLSEEALAGVDIQRMALEELEALYGHSGLAGDIEQLTSSALALVSQIDSLGEILESLNQIILDGGDPGFWIQLSEQILEWGDLLLFQDTPWRGE